jgi:hypothetical protein
MRFGKAQVSARLEDAVDFFDRVVDVWVQMMQSADNRDEVKRIAVQPGI